MPLSLALAWMSAHPLETLALIGAILSVVNGALPASVQRSPVGRVIHATLDRLAVLSRSDAAGTLKWPGVASALLSVPAPAAPVAPPSVGPLAPAADPVAPALPTPVEPSPVLRAVTVSYRPQPIASASDDGNAAAYELARREVAAARVFDPLARQTIAPDVVDAAKRASDQSGHVEGGAMMGACVLALAASLLCSGCPDWQRPACTTPGAYACVQGQPHYCARATHELTPVGDESCAAQGRACAINDAGIALCVRASDGGAE